jgi:hypothetical protein
MSADLPLTHSQHVVQACLFLAAAIAIFGGSLQMILGQPDTLPRLDNVHRFMAGVYLGTGVICLWAGITVRCSPDAADCSRSARSDCPGPRRSGSAI